MPAGEIRQLLEALTKEKVRFIVVGGVAVVLHGHPRLTVDLDLVIALDPENVRALLRALLPLGYRPRAPVPAERLADENERRRWSEEKNMQVFTLWSPSLPGTDVDVFIREPFPFDEMMRRSVGVTLGALTVAVGGIDDIVAMKRQAGRPVDADDIAALEEIARIEKEEGSA
ncbi:MAG: nucleotidyl transferase AbiEii/AbiGii toxin family protein [Myxococcales bacterium]|nr:nucleotidyl transferase AbiEii/AbiGii toxin family protein [Myxococcales bacterium]